MRKNLSGGTLICLTTLEVEKAMKMVVDYVGNNYNVEVYFENEEGNYFTPTPFDEIEELEYSFGFIEIDENQTHEIQLYSLLHEAGHVKEYYERYENLQNPNYVASSEGINRETIAWEYGFEISTKLGIKMQIEKWNLYKNICLDAYREEE